jgi:Protein of unknown function (DUF2934)
LKKRETMPRVTKTTPTIEKPAAPKRRVSATPRASEVFIAEAFIDVSPDEVAHEAYALYLERGGMSGDAVGDWLEAERRIRERRLSQVAAPAASTPRPSRARAASSAR